MATADIRLNLKKLLMEFGNRLVRDARFDPSGPMPRQLQHELKADHSTEPITVFTEWLNQHPEARDILESMGVDWPV